MVGNDAYTMPEMPEGCEEGIVKGMYKFRSTEGSNDHVQLFGSGAIMPGVWRLSKSSPTTTESAAMSGASLATRSWPERRKRVLAGICFTQLKRQG